MARREIYNTIDCKERLLLIGIEKDKYGGYKQDLLEKDLGETEIDFYVCVKCVGLMRNACLVNGPDPILVCEACKIGEDFIPMVKARKNIPRLRAKCPLMKRGCVWKGSLREINAHLDECAEFILNCSKGCGVLLKRSELQNHCENECQLRIVKCKYCGATIQSKLLDNHNIICLEFPLVCPNECLRNLIRKELKSHIEKECPNTLITCPYKEMGCEVLSKRSELPKHEKTFESKHFDQTKIYYFHKVKKMESILQEKEDEIKQLTAKVRNMEKEYQRSKISKSLVLIEPTVNSGPSEVFCMPAFNMPISSKSFRGISDSEKAAEDQEIPLIINDYLYSTNTHSQKYGHKNDNNSESLTYEAKDTATKSKKSPKPPFTISPIEWKHSDHYEASITKSIRMTGFYNLGNSCYFKSVLQNLLHLRSFREHLICTLTRTEYRLVLEKYPHLNTFINSDKKGRPKKLIKWAKLLRATTNQSEATKGSHNRSISMQNECLLRIVKCKYCGATIQRKVSENHNKICPEFPFVCPNKCLKSLIRKELESHIEKECPNTLIACPYKEMGCEVLTKRSELPKHQKTFESKHLDKTKVFDFNKMKKLESILQEKEDENKQLTAKVRKMEKNKNSESSGDNDCKDNKTKFMYVIGLYNLGNTCYFNSVLQNLLYLRPFRERLSYTMTRTKYKLVPRKHPELETIVFSPEKKSEPGKLTQELFNLIQETVYQSEVMEGTFGKKAIKKIPPKIAKPRAVQTVIARKHDKFSDGSQQNSHELFRFMIDMVKDEEIKRLKEAFLKHFNIKNGKTRSKNCSVDRKNLKKYASEFENIFVFTGTFIDDTFGGKMMSTVKCEGCDSILDVNEDFLDISLTLPEYSKEYNILSSNQPKSEIGSNSEEEVKVKSKKVKILNKMPNYYPKDSLEYYLMRFFSPMFLEEDYVCNYCNPQLVSKLDDTSDASSDENDDSDSIDYDALKFTSAVKQFHIKTVGPVLTIHLKRFSQTGYGLLKLNKRVEFPLVLDMSPFCTSDTPVLKDCNNQILYGLRGMVDHSGGMSGGHYVANVNIADWNKPFQPTPPLTSSSHLKHVMPAEDWYHISDSHVSKTNHDQVFSSQAYMLFYERLPLVTRDTHVL